ncbi:hypothetical protein TNCV_1416381 [Trichonephila clavipes]|nr:hypothetical protein TNCV_1416381 [Trichonephila clavipes]
MPSRAVKLNLSTTPFNYGVYEIVTSCFIPSSVKKLSISLLQNSSPPSVLTAITFLLRKRSARFSNLINPWLSVDIGPQRSICNNSNGRFDLTAPVILNETLLDFANFHGIQ